MFANLAPGQPARTPVTNDVLRYPLPLLALKDYTIQNIHDGLQKTVMNLIVQPWKPKSPLFPKRNRTPQRIIKIGCRELGPAPPDCAAGPEL
ncbi:Hypothetical protein NGAL_HAMBI1145_15720 [Neorhizobium galegae bv. officinalis]|uniref:Uncharacterized protein n=1 Tax=Neorhizobium galegae bv. officinalis TaxID=323656 RepID=A0A0T7FD83_NEOGA|nr:Hypothetical protein NGAL_HAMBI1145_15720 [Neorhizobium galegae bv. officinalis]